MAFRSRSHFLRAVRAIFLASVPLTLGLGALHARAAGSGTKAPAASAAAAARAESTMKHQLVRRLAVFPLEAPKELSSAADDAWWQAREELTKSHRFLVASKQFLLKSDAFQPRGALEPADAILLGKLLDAHALITGRLDGRKLTMAAYDGTNGVTLWRREYALHPSIAIQDQLASAARKVVDDFLASFPYQAFQIVDPLVGSPVYEESDLKVAQIDVGAGSAAQVGDSLQWIRVESDNLKPLFQGGARIGVFAEGRILKVEQGVATAELLRIEKGRAIKEYDLVRLPREFDRLQAQYALQQGMRTTLSADLVSPEAAPMETVIRERRPLAVVASFVGSVAAFLLLAF